jgi:hypothetical protein
MSCDPIQQKVINNLTVATIQYNLYNQHCQELPEEAPVGTTQGISDGYWVMLKPLPVGDHTIHIAGSVVNYAEGTLSNFANEVTYHIKVQ